MGQIGLMLRGKFVFQGIALATLSFAGCHASAQSSAGLQAPRILLARSLEAPASIATRKVDSSSGGDSNSESHELDSPFASYQASPSVSYEDAGPFSSWQIGIKASSLGAGVDLATPLTRRLGLRGQFNFIAFNYPFDIDGVNYDSHLNLRSGSLSMDWYPTRHSFRISPGIMYFNDHLDAIASVPPGSNFELGDQGFINSVDDPVNGTMSAVFPHHVAPMVTFAINLLGGRYARFTMPVELGFAYTGAPRVSVTFDGTACMDEGCFTFADNPEALESLQAEIAKLNRKLTYFPVYPIASVGFAYRFGQR